MSIKSHIDDDLKQAMLAGKKDLVTTLRGLKSALQYAEVAKGAQAQGLSEEEIMQVLAKEAKKRQESADMYVLGGSPERAEAETVEKEVIEAYLPAPMSEEALDELIKQVIDELKAPGMQAMGQVVGEVKKRTQGMADGATIARKTKEKLAS